MFETLGIVVVVAVALYLLISLFCTLRAYAKWINGALIGTEVLRRGKFTISMRIGFDMGWRLPSLLFSLVLMRIVIAFGFLFTPQRTYLFVEGSPDKDLWLSTFCGIIESEWEQVISGGIEWATAR